MQDYLLPLQLVSFITWSLNSFFSSKISSFEILLLANYFGFPECNFICLITKSSPGKAIVGECHLWTFGTISFRWNWLLWMIYTGLDRSLQHWEFDIFRYFTRIVFGTFGYSLSLLTTGIIVILNFHIFCYIDLQALIIFENPFFGNIEILCASHIT